VCCIRKKGSVGGGTTWQTRRIRLFLHLPLFGEKKRPRGEGKYEKNKSRADQTSEGMRIKSVELIPGTPKVSGLTPLTQRGGGTEASRRGARGIQKRTVSAGQAGAGVKTIDFLIKGERGTHGGSYRRHVLKEIEIRFRILSSSLGTQGLGKQGSSSKSRLYLAPIGGKASEEEGPKEGSLFARG